MVSGRSEEFEYSRGYPFAGGPFFWSRGVVEEKLFAEDAEREVLAVAKGECERARGFLKRCRFDDFKGLEAELAGVVAPSPLPSSARWEEGDDELLRVDRRRVGAPGLQVGYSFV